MRHLMFLGAILGFASISPIEARTLSLAEKAAVEKSVRARLKDPDSAKFSHPLLNIPNGPNNGGFYCGTVNSKNSYGGYTGAVAFLAGFGTFAENGKTSVVGEAVEIGDADPDSVSSKWLDRMCSDPKNGAMFAR